MKDHIVLMSFIIIVGIFWYITLFKGGAEKQSEKIKNYHKKVKCYHGDNSFHYKPIAAKLYMTFLLIALVGIMIFVSTKH